MPLGQKVTSSGTLVSLVVLKAEAPPQLPRLLVQWLRKEKDRVESGKLRLSSSEEVPLIV